MTISFNHKSKLSTVGTGNYIFRHYGAGTTTAYYELDYIEGTGSQHFDSGCKGDEIGKIEVAFTPYIVNGVWNAVLYAEEVSSPYNGCGIRINTSNKLSFSCGSSTTGRYDTSWTATANTKYTINWDLLNRNLIINNTSYTSARDDTTLTSKNVYVLADNGSSVGQRGRIRLHYLKIYDRSYNLVRNYIPLMRVSDLKVGLFDLVNSTFNTSQGYTDFVPGLKIAGYSQLDYLQSSGTQWINPNLTSGNVSVVDTMFVPTNVNTSWQSVIATEKNGSPYDGIKVRQNTSKKLTAVYGTGSYTGTSNMTNNTPYDSHIDGPNNIFVLDGTQLTSSFNTLSFNGPLAIFANGANLLVNGTVSQYGYYRIYFMNIYDTSNVLSRLYIPMRKTSGSVLGLYDIKYGVFYQNAGSGTFSYGVVTITDDDTDADIVYYHTVEPTPPTPPPTPTTYTISYSCNDYYYFSYNGTNYKNSGTLQIPVGGSITAYCVANPASGTTTGIGNISVNGNVVASTTSSGTISYTYTPASDIRVNGSRIVNTSAYMTTTKLNIYS